MELDVRGRHVGVRHRDVLRVWPDAVIAGTGEYGGDHPTVYGFSVPMQHGATRWTLQQG